MAFTELQKLINYANSYLEEEKKMMEKANNGLR
jgi:hypothetical protein